MDCGFDGPQDSGFPAVPETLGKAIANQLASLQAQLCAYLQQQAQGTDPSNLSQAVTGWKLLLDNLVQLALPNQSAASDTLTGLLRGSDSIFDVSGIAAEFGARAAAPK